MSEINYIKHLNGVLLQFSKDSRLNTTHVSLYMALFQLWNQHRFPNSFYINRQEVMEFSKIGSKSTYHRCIKELTYWKYLIYYPSHNPFKGSKIKLFDFGTSDGQLLDSDRPNLDPSSGQAVVPYTNNTKPIQTSTNSSKLAQPKNENEVLVFFKTKQWPALEGKKFYNHYQSIGWKIGGKTKIVDWHATARNWMIKAGEIKILQTSTAQVQKQDNLRTSTDKNYDEPL